MAAPPIVKVSPLQDLAQLAQRWQALEQQGQQGQQGQGHFFQSWMWVHARLAAAPAPTLVLEVFQDSQLIGLAFARLKRVWRKGFLPVTLLYFNDFGRPEHDVVCVEHNDFLWAQGVSPSQRQAVWQAVLNLPAPGFTGLFVRSASAQAHSDLQTLGYGVHKESFGPTHGVDLIAVQRAGGLLPLLSANTRQQIRRSARLYEERGTLKFDIAQSTEQALAFYHALCKLHQLRWQARAQPSITDYPAQLAMHQRLIAAGVPTKAVVLARISAGEVDIGYLFLTCWQGRVDFYLGALCYEDEPRLKPGLMAHWLAIEHFAAQGFGYYDFLAGHNQAKQQLGTPGPSLDSLIVRKKRWIFVLEDLGRALKGRLYSRAQALKA
jgi:CelD/BcsL family acetyltransferase involved in cellulose biosynthesis